MLAQVDEVLASDDVSNPQVPPPVSIRITLGICNHSGARDFSDRREDWNDEHRPFREPTKDWSPERLAANEASVEKRLAELDRHQRERKRDERTSHAATEEAQSRSPRLTR